MPRSQKSFGIALCRQDGDQLQVVMVKKRFTYQFFEFAYGKYKKNDDAYLGKLLSGMTYREKMLIANLNFSEIWSNIWMASPENYNQNRLLQRPKGKGFISDGQYFKKKTKFNANFLNDGARIRRLIDDSKNSEANWEIPKGHKSGCETDIDAAAREFEEETGLRSTDYDIMWHVPPIVEKYNDRGIYQNVYFLATCRGDVIPKVLFKSPKQFAEVECIKWVSLKEIQFLRLVQQVHDRNLRLFKLIKSKYRKKKLVDLLEI